MIDLTEAMADAEATGDEVRAECLDEVLEALARGIVNHHRRGDRDVNEETLNRAIEEIRAYCYRESDLQ